MCTSAIALSKIRRLYYGASDSKFGGIENRKYFASKSAYHKPEIYLAFLKRI